MFKDLTELTQAEEGDIIKNNVVEFFDKSVSSIKEINKTEGFKAIISYLENQKRALEMMFLRGVSNDYLLIAQGRYREVCGLLLFLSNPGK